MHSVHVACFDRLLQQPFVLVRHSRHVPVFDERFVGWLFNRVQQVEHLRLLGFEFRLLAHAYGELVPSEDVESVADEGLRRVPNEGVESVADEGLERVTNEALKRDTSMASVGKRLDQGERMKSLFKTWYSEMKDQRRVERTRVCSEDDRRKRETVIQSYLP